MKRPRKPHRPQVAFRAGADLIAALDDECMRRGVSRSELINVVLRRRYNLAATPWDLPTENHAGEKP